jgi:hypothetical protein
MIKNLLTIILTFTLLIGYFVDLNTGSYELFSPDGHIRVKVSTDRGIHFTVSRDGKSLLVNARVNVTLNRI